MSQSTIFSVMSGRSHRLYFRGVKCLVQGHNMAEVGFEPWASRSGARRSATEPPRSPHCNENITKRQGKMTVVLPIGCPRSVWFWQGFAGQKVKSPLFPWAGVRGYK